MIRLSRLALALVATLWAGLAQAACSEGAVDLRGPWGQARFSVEIADTDETRARGLMHRERLARSAGMLFIYDRPVAASFWMRNTLISLDMIFVDPTGRVSHIHHEAIPLDETPIPGGENVLMVLEINGGLARAMGITEGSEMRHPRLDQDGAVWPCDS
ncbi:DUF192 domain-containing protein [Natronohydrobacter thiooxidans]|uniref:DUF192 domain-containing protein n=1 Tax=Natronohydrobacter thiooxidans TaxID=87172 RepID=UPI0008FF4FB5|nr:DUF192 domain-containing protein [Natronohydrobacter thiooxidans]